MIFKALSAIGEDLSLTLLAGHQRSDPKSGKKKWRKELIGVALLGTTTKQVVKILLPAKKKMSVVEEGQEQVLYDTKGLPTFSITLAPSLTFDLCQLNNTQNHGTTVWDSAKVLAFYLMDTIKRPSWVLDENKNGRQLQIQNSKKCIELGSGCGLGGLTMGALGFDTILTDLPAVVDHVLETNRRQNQRHIKDWWYQLLEQSHKPENASLPLEDPKVKVKALDWLDLCAKRCCDKEEENDDEQLSWLEPPYNYILAADCIYTTELVRPLLKCISYLASPTSTILVALEHRDDIVVNIFVQQAKSLGFDTRMIPKKSLRTKAIRNDDIEIWKLKKKRSA